VVGLLSEASESPIVTIEQEENGFGDNGMSTHLSVVMNGQTYTRSGRNWIDEKRMPVPAFLRSLLDAALAANANPKESLTKGRGSFRGRGSDQRVKRKRKG
jgi:hypothetical protein